MNRYVQPPISRLPSADLQSSGMEFMTGGGAPYGSNPATWSPTVVTGGTIVRRADGSMHDVGNFGMRHGKRSMHGYGVQGDLVSRKKGIFAPGNFA
jgi:hypothetical protein